MLSTYDAGTRSSCTLMTRQQCDRLWASNWTSYRPKHAISAFLGAIYPHFACVAASVSRGPSGVAWFVCVDDYEDQERNSFTCQSLTNK